MVDPSWSLVVILEVLAEDIPPPPAEDTEVASGSSLRRAITAESSFMVMELVSVLLMM